MQTEELRSDFSLRDLLRVFFDKFNILVVTVIAALLATFIILKFITPMYKATVKVLISGQKAVESPYYKELMYGTGSNVVMTQSEIVRSKAVLERTVSTLGLDKRLPTLRKYNSVLKNISLSIIDFPKKVLGGVKDFFVYTMFGKAKPVGQSDFDKAVALLKKDIKVKRIVETDVFEITVFDYDPLMAKNIANVLSRSYVLFDLEQQLAEMKLKFGAKYPMVLQLEDSIANLNQNLSKDLSDVEAIGPASVKIIEQATKPENPAYPQKSVAYLLALVISFMVGVLVITFYAYFDQSFKSPKDLEDHMNLPLLGSLPLIREDRLFARQRSLGDRNLFNKQLRILSDQVYLLCHDKKIKSLIFASIDSGEGTTTAVFNLARMIAKNHGYKTVVVDCNLRCAAVHKFFRIEEGPGLSEVLENKEQLDKSLKKIDNNLFVLTSGKTELNPVVLFNSSKIEELLGALKEKFDLVILDAPFLKEYKDAYILSSKADGIVLVVDMLKARRQIVQMHIKPFDEKKIIGAIFNRRLYHIPDVIYRNF